MTHAEFVRELKVHIDKLEARIWGQPQSWLDGWVLELRGLLAKSPVTDDLVNTPCLFSAHQRGFAFGAVWAQSLSLAEDPIAALVKAQEADFHEYRKLLKGE